MDKCGFTNAKIALHMLFYICGAQHSLARRPTFYKYRGTFYKLRFTNVKCQFSTTFVYLQMTNIEENPHL